MNNKIKESVFVFLLFLFVVVLGYECGVFFAKRNGRAIDDKVVAFRVGVRKDYVDYDLLAMLDFIKYKYEKDGYTVKEYAYEGNLYPKRLDNAGVNLFVRGDFVSYDKRINEKAYNVYLIQRFVGGYIEEFRNFDEYISTQNNLIEAAKMNGVEVKYLEGGSAKRENLDFKDAKNILYIYEIRNFSVIDKVKNIKNAKVFSTVDFALLSENERKEELKNAKIVVFDRDLNRFSEKDYVPYAIYDLISYGKKVISNAPKEGALPDSVVRFRTTDEMIYLMEKY